MDNPIRPLFDPSVMPARDEDGMCCHPDLDERWNRDDNEEVFDLTKFVAQGFDLAFIWFESDADEAMMERYVEEGGPNVSYWTPSVPVGKGWQLVGIWDTEDMPLATYLRKAVSA